MLKGTIYTFIFILIVLKYKLVLSVFWCCLVFVKELCEKLSENSNFFNLMNSHLIYNT